MTAIRLRPDPTPDEQIAWYAERAAVLQCAIRRLAAHVHRQHAPPSDPPWTRCADRWCQLAHDAVEGRYAPASVTEHGRVISLARKEA